MAQMTREICKCSNKIENKMNDLMFRVYAVKTNPKQ